MGFQKRIFPEIYLTAITAIVFLPMMYLLNNRSDFDIWRFSILFVALIVVIFGYSYIDIKRRIK
ncbi:MAG: hypothetical protein NWE89_13745 [Candidatus Bathyarchaeota archaeon]|nr:hypothetical protein [Candidatus Bathyarchaeota archaeon]